ncbi:MAG TPA: tRNA uridine-5-carboxymethylaminomethyl(34) synthesis GTPase MnmE [Treponemataceae bacterium]|jgi:tRNA modification GTPase|nr:tRNA uridine-5-carboxymethylaminomethyl(34) synthesis GTPase MnmE [Treponemataceae bacterium]
MNNNNYLPQVPIAAIATALAPSALAVIRTSGSLSIELVSSVFSRSKALLQAQGNTTLYGWIVDGDEKIDEVILAVYRAPKSFTGENMVEIFCHGGTSPVLSVFNLLLRSGFRQAERGEFSFRAFLNGKTDLTRAEAVREIIESKTGESRSRAAGRLSGNLEEQLTSIKHALIHTLGTIEVEIEYPEDEETIADAFDTTELKETIVLLKKLSSSWKCEKLYQEGARIILSGKTNAGKSSLFNALLKEERAIVSDVHGTTRDWIESYVSFDGIPARLFDTAGLRETQDLVEKRGVEMTYDLSRDADIVLYLLDSRYEVTNNDVSFLEALVTRSTTHVPSIVVFTKSDLKQADIEAAKPLFKSCNISQYVSVCSKTGDGIHELGNAVKTILLQGSSTERDQAGLGSERQKKSVDEAVHCLEHALFVYEKDYTLDAVVQDIEDALEALSSITGEVTPEDVLGSIFANFCVGK